MFFPFPSETKTPRRIESNDDFSPRRTFAVWQVRRDEEFSPLKNAAGAKDTAATCRRDLMLLHLRWLEKAGAELPVDSLKHLENNTKLCEISPLVSYAGEVNESRGTLPPHRHRSIF